MAKVCRAQREVGALCADNAGKPIGPFDASGFLSPAKIEMPARVAQLVCRKTNRAPSIDSNPPRRIGRSTPPASYLLDLDELWPGPVLRPFATVLGSASKNYPSTNR